MVDFEEPGKLGVFIDDEQLKALEERMSQAGYLDGSELSNTFNMMRANDLIWSFVVNNYLLGKEPFPFDLLYWNSARPGCRRSCTAFICARCTRKTAS